MKTLTLCIIAALATAMAGCVDDAPDMQHYDDDAGYRGADDGGEPSDGADGGGGLVDGACPQPTTRAAASHIVIQVSWPESTGIEAGQGEVHLWTKATMAVNDDNLGGTVRICGVRIPALTKKAAAGGGQLLLEIPDAAWDTRSMPVFRVTGTTTGIQVGDTFTVERAAATLGLAMADPLNDPWPEQRSQLLTRDHDGDGHPGIKAVPRTDAPFGAPAIDLQSHVADEIYLAARTVMSLSGTRDTCTTARGTAEVTSVDSHVVGCHVQGGAACTSAQTDLIDGTQPRFAIAGGSFEMVQIPEAAPCADVRAALPAD